MSASGNKRKAVLHGQELKCKNGCGFYGNPEWHGYCSKCHREINQKVKTEPRVKGTGKKVTRSYSDAQESSYLGFSKFEEKKKQQSEKRSKTIKSIIKRNNTAKDSGSTHSPSREFFTVTEQTQFIKEFGLKDAAMKDVVKQINTQLDIMSKHFDKSIDEQSEIMQDFYNFMTNRFEIHAHYQELSSEQIDQLLDKIEEKLMSMMYRTVFQLISTEYEEKDLAMQKRIRSLNWITTQRLCLDIRENSPEIRDLIDKAITDVIEMDSKISPQDKIGCIVNCSKIILNIINLCQGVTVSADEFLPAMVYIVLKGNPPLLHSNIKYITSYSIPARLRSGEGAYYFTNLCCAVEFIEKLTAESLNLSDAEFERYLTGEVPVDYNEQSVTSCEGLRLMSQNLITLTEIQDRNNKVLDDMIALKIEMTTFEQTLQKCKPTSPLKLKSQPYSIVGQVDMSLIPEILRSRVIIEESNEILVDIDSKFENEEQTAKLSTEPIISQNAALSDFQNLTFESGIDVVGQTVMDPLKVALPEVSNSISEASSRVPDNNIVVNQAVLDIKDLEYPIEIFPDTKSEENPVSMDIESSVNTISYIGSTNTLIDPLVENTDFLEEPPLNLPPPLLPIVIQSEKSENDKSA